MGDKILLQNMVFYGFHGVYEYERTHGQRFYVDLEMTTDMSEAARTDDLAATVDYTAVYAQVKQVIETEKFQLLEALSCRIADMVLQFPFIMAVTVRVRKPAAPIPGLDFVQVEFTRKR